MSGWLRIPRQHWSAPQRGVIIGLLCLILLYVLVRLIINPTYVSDPQPQTPPRFAELEDRIDPNTADASTLAALPQIGEKRARDIVAYRDQFVADHPGQLAFTKLEDFYRIRGFGAAMVSLMEPYLIFPTSRPSTQP